MKNQRSMWLIPVLAVGVLGFGLYGYQEHQNRTTALQLAENQLQGSYHRFASHLNLMQASLAKVLVTTEPHSVERELSNAVKETSGAVANLEALPSRLSHGGALMEYLTHTSAYLNQLQLSHLGGKALTASEQQKLTQLNRQATRLKQSASQTQADLIRHARSFPLTSAAVAVGMNVNNIGAQTHFDALDAAAKQMLGENRRTHLDPAQAVPTKTASALTAGSVVTSHQAVQIAQRFLGVVPAQSQRVQKLGSGFPYQGYLVTLNQGTKERDSVAVSVHGGRVIWMTRTLTGAPAAKGTSSKQVNPQQIALHYLKTRGPVASLTLLRSLHSGREDSYAFAPVRQGVVIEPQVLLVKVQAFGGTVTSYDASAYYEHQSSLPSLRPRITARQAQVNLSHQFRVTANHLAIVDDATLHPRLVYVIRGQKQGSQYRVLVDASNGDQLSIERLSSS